MRNLRVLAIAVVLLYLQVPIASAGQRVPSPKDVIGFEPGEDRKLADWAAVNRYFQRLAAASDRVSVETIGTTTLGRPMLLATISSPANLRRVERVGSSRVDLQACKLEYSIVSPK